jgi:hypothetical protein
MIVPECIEIIKSYINASFVTQFRHQMCLLAVNLVYKSINKTHTQGCFCNFGRFSDYSDNASHI